MRLVGCAEPSRRHSVIELRTTYLHNAHSKPPVEWVHDYLLTKTRDLSSCRDSRAWFSLRTTLISAKVLPRRGRSGLHRYGAQTVLSERHSVLAAHRKVRRSQNSQSQMNGRAMQPARIGPRRTSGHWTTAGTCKQAGRRPSHSLKRNNKGGQPQLAEFPVLPRRRALFLCCMPEARDLTQGNPARAPTRPRAGHCCAVPIRTSVATCRRPEVAGRPDP